MQRVGTGHDTRVRALDEVGLGLGTTNHFEPFQRSTNDFVVEPLP